NLAWPGDAQSSPSGGAGTSAPLVTLQDYCNKLVQNDYLKPGDLQKILTAPSANCTVTYDTTASSPTVTLGGKSALKVYKVTGNDASNTLFAVTANYTYDKPLNTTDVPYGDKGFVVMRKGGDASVFRKNQATDTNTGGDITKFQNFMGVLTGAKTSESADMVLTNPQG
ncbi:MAG TPA: hypothetical protein VE821_16535, partial [Pyrinomonadaceae bacterium]|nr:hypothetical protein [Pyrinomonadaceae bacterium]